MRFTTHAFALVLLFGLSGCGKDPVPPNPPPPSGSTDPAAVADGPTDDLEPAVAKKLAHVRQRAQDEDSTTAWLHYARVLHAHRMYGEAEQAYATAGAKAGKPKFETLYLAGICAQYRDPERAQALFEQAVQLRNEFAPLHARLGDLWLERGEWLAAKTHYTLIGAHGPTSDERVRRRAARLGMARVALASGDPAEAKSELEKIDVEHRTRGVLEALARAEHALGNQAAARAAAIAARTASPEPPLDDPYLTTVRDEGVSFMNHIAFALSYERRGELLRALGRLDAALAARPENPDALLMRARVLQGLRRHAEAIEAYGAALEHGANEAEASEGVARSQAANGDVDQAVTILRRILAKHPDRARSLLLLAHLQKRDDPTSARTHVVRVLRLDPLNSGAQRLFSEILLALNRFEQGTQYLAEVSPPDTTRAEALAALERALTE